MSDMQDWNSLKHVEEWVGSHSLGDLRDAINTGRFAGQRMTLAKAWLDAYDREAAEVASHDAAQIQLRGLAAAESQAASAKRALLVAWLAFGASLIAIVVSVVAVVQGKT